MATKASGSARGRWLARVGVVALAAVAIVAIDGRTAHAVDTSAKISTQVMADTANGGRAPFIVVLQSQADLSKAYGMKDQNARGWYVYNTLKEHAAETQGPILAELDAWGVSHKSFWVANMISSSGDRSLVQDLASRADVKSIETNDAADGLEGEEGVESTDGGNAVAATEVGVTNTTSPSLWALGFKGQGMVVANQDTGMRWTHAAIRNHYRGWISGTTADHNYNWHDSIHARIDGSDGGTASGTTNSCGYNLVVPCDDQGHGTHTTGTTIGDDVGVGVGTNQIGVAPSAKWIGCRNMDAGNGRATTYSECFQWFIAPTDLANANADPTKRPHVMNNSWTCPLVGELCARNVFQTIVDNTIASGIFVEVSAGNEGSACNTVQDPPAIYANAFSTGAINGSTNALTSFSSRGTVTSDGSGRMKPDLVAPGNNVRSSLRTSDTTYGNMSGTSMAGPHVVGVVALLWSARANLVRDIPRTEWVLTRAANRTGVTVPNNSSGCGGIVPTPNNHFGWGRVDALAAYNLEPSLNQSITFPALPGKTYGDADFAPGASASSSLAVSYSASGNCTIVSGLVHITGAGSCTVTALQAGLDVYDIANTGPKPWYPAGDVQRIFAIAKANQAISIGTHAPSSALFGTGFTVAATGGGSGNAIVYASSGGCSNTGADFTMTSGSSDCTVTYDQAGDSNYNAAPQQSEVAAAQKADQAILIGTHAPSSAVYGTGFTVSATGGGSGNAIVYASSGGCSNTGGDVTMTSGSSDCTVTYDQAGDSNYNAAPELSDTVTAQKASQAITVTQHAPVNGIYAKKYNTSGIGGGSGNSVAYGASGVCTISGSEITMTSGTGTCIVTYDQAGDSNYDAAPQQFDTVNAQKADQTITVGTHAPSSAVYGTSFAVSATGGGSGNPVLFSRFGKCVATDSGDFKMTGGTGTCTVMYDQAGDSNYDAAPQQFDTVNAQKAALSITANNRSKFYAQALTLGTTAFSTSGLVAPDSITGVTLSSPGATAFAAPGSYAISVSSAVGGPGTDLANNYTVSYHVGSLTVTPVGLIGLNGVTVDTVAPVKIDSFDSSAGPYGALNHGNHAMMMTDGILIMRHALLFGNAESTLSSVSIEHGSTISGNVTAGTSVSNAGTVSGTITQNHPDTALSAPTVAACSPYSPTQAVTSGAKYKYSSTTGNLQVLAGILTLKSGTYCFHNVSITLGATLQVSSQVTIHMTGKLGGTGGFIVNTTNRPAYLNFTCSFTGADGIVIAGNAHAAMTIVAPGTDVRIHHGGFFGTLFAGTVTLAKGVAFHAAN